MENLQNLSEDVLTITDALSRLTIDTSTMQGQELNVDVLDWYKERFIKLQEDGVPIAINAYLNKLQTDSRANEYTRLVIMKAATDILLQED